MSRRAPPPDAAATLEGWPAVPTPSTSAPCNCAPARDPPRTATCAGSYPLGMASGPAPYHLGALQRRPGEGRGIAYPVASEPRRLGGAAYAAAPAEIPTRLDISRMTGNGYALRLR